MSKNSDASRSIIRRKRIKTDRVRISSVQLSKLFFNIANFRRTKVIFFIIIQNQAKAEPERENRIRKKKQQRVRESNRHNRSSRRRADRQAANQRRRRASPGVEGVAALHARDEGRRHGALRVLQRRAREPAARCGGRRRAAPARAHGRPGVRQGG
ncbi:hypothetical protein BAE44_0010649 [Dichanthelium oligosanthes]|uniref:Uncharacterized protein n=1 Tax=Dichanthelium oligosanthes TaxID=888268 RepID=A0A1E5VTC9_9POAL|nr:hypothetical protein BAE44_0010649 [Dichanthelium oligosanthes]